jgi:heat shock protein HslJ
MSTHLIRTQSSRSSWRFLSCTLTRLAAFSTAALLAACALPKHPDSAAPPTDPFNPAATQLLDDTQWELTRWTEANGQPRDLPHGAQSGGQPLTLDFSTQTGRRRVSGYAGCNRFAGTYDLKDGKVTFGPLAGTRMACAAGPGGALEQPYLDGLAHIAKSGVQMNPPQTLELTLDDGQIMTFAQRTK